MVDFVVSEWFEWDFGRSDGSRKDGADDWVLKSPALQGDFGTVLGHRTVEHVVKLGERVSAMDAGYSRDFISRESTRTRGEAHGALADVDANQARVPRHRHVVRSRDGGSQVFAKVQLQVFGRGRRAPFEEL